MGIVPTDESDPTEFLGPDLVGAARGIGMAVAMRLMDLAPALRPAGTDGSEPQLVIESIVLDPHDPTDPVTLIACIQAHDAYVRSRGRPAGASPGALALARVLVWSVRAEALGPAPRIAWIGPPSRRPADLAGHDVTAEVRLSGSDGPVRAAAVLVVG
ncbi:MAG: hypothetical protein EXQ74_06105 [Thermoleophilia bacterium]|nr:hypothetical protein [Thermoleophilia bacterium]